MYFWKLSFHRLVMRLSWIALCWSSNQRPTWNTTFRLFLYTVFAVFTVFDFYTRLFVCKTCKIWSTWSDRTKAVCYYHKKSFKILSFYYEIYCLRFSHYLLITHTWLGILFKSCWRTVDSFNDCCCNHCH